ncbi:MAG: alpha/beta fold hydrolase [Armatimonadetes bacterium]|nr:alpha/beta fold hydrolase [Planctomycetota bacterium]MBI2200899.1 alpha/beta fold hydrolase [Armatimonadota bacterium]
MSSESRRQQLYDLLGELPDRQRPVSARKVATEERPGHVLEKLVLDLNGIEDVPAYFVRPTGLKGRVPAFLYNHAHGGAYSIGKEEFIKPRGGFQEPPYAEALAAHGYCGLCIDAWNFGERAGRTESELFKQMLWHGRVLWGMMVYDSLRAVDYLITREEVNPGRVATVGLSMGSTMAWWLAALDPRIRVTVDICCLTDFHALIETRGLDGHGIYYYVPGLLKHFTTAQINALIAPRAHLSLAGNYDRLTPPAGLDRIDRELQQVYAGLGAGDRWKLLRYETGHFETAAMRVEILDFVERWL